MISYGIPSKPNKFRQLCVVRVSLVAFFFYEQKNSDELDF